MIELNIIEVVLITVALPATAAVAYAAWWLPRWIIRTRREATLYRKWQAHMEGEPQSKTGRIPLIKGDVRPLATRQPIAPEAQDEASETETEQVVEPGVYTHENDEWQRKCKRCGVNPVRGARKHLCKSCHDGAEKQARERVRKNSTAWYHRNKAAKKANDPEAADEEQPTQVGYRVASRMSASRRRRDTVPPGLTDEQVLDHLASRTTQSGGCRIWMGAVNTLGMPSVFHDNRMQTVHRLIYSIAHGPESIRRRRVMRSCRNNLCVNPDHLRTSDDAIEDDAGARANGHAPEVQLDLPPTQTHPGRGNPKLSDEDIQTAIQLYRDEGWSSTDIAELLDVNPPSIIKRLRKAGVEIRTRGGRYLEEVKS